MGPGSRCARPGRQMFGFHSSHDFKQPFAHTFPLRGSLAPRSLLSCCPAPNRGAGGAPIRRINDRACEARLTTLTRRGSHRLQAGALASRRSAWRFRLRVPHFRGPPLLLRDRVLSPATATGQNPRGSSPPGRNLRGSAPRASSRHGFSPRSPRTPSLAPPSGSPLEDAPR